MVYIRMNRHLLSGIDKEIKKFLPIRKSNNGVEPGMASKGIKGKEGSEKQQWIFTRKTPNEEEMKKILGMVAEIGIRI